MASMADGVLLECVATIIGRKLENLAQVIEDDVFQPFISKLKEGCSPPGKFSTSASQLQNTIKEYFLRDDLVDFEKASGGDSLELSKLLLLLLYMSFIADKNVRTLLYSALDHKMQLKLKYLFECIQKRGSGLSQKYLGILASENLDKLACSSERDGRSWGLSSPPVLYTSSPKAASRQSPLRELVQSPNFVVQRKLESRMKDVKRLNQELTDLENEKQDWLLQQQIYQKRQAKLEQEVEQLREQQATLRKDRDDLESLVLVGEDQIHQQAQRLGRELSLARSDNISLQQTLKEVMDTNEQLSTKEETARSQLQELRKERQTLQVELLQLQEQHLLTASAMDERDLLLHEHAKRIQDLEQHLLEARQRPRPHNFTIESFDASVASPPPFAEEMSAASRLPPSSPGVSENLGAAVVDLLLQETRQQLHEAQQQFAALRQQHTELQGQHTAALQQHELASKLMEEEQKALKESHEQLRAELQQQCDSHTHTKQEMGNQLQQVQEQLQRATLELTQLQEQSKSLSTQLEQTCAAEAALKQTMTDTVARLNTEHQQQLSEVQQQCLLKVSAQEQQLAASQTTVSELQTEVARLSSAYSTKEQELTNARSQATEAQSQLNEARTSLEGKVAEITALELLKQELSDQVIEREKEIQAAKQECHEKQMKLDEKESELQCIGVNLETIKKDGEKLFSESIAKVDSLSEDKLQLEAKLSQVQAESLKQTCALQEKDAALQNLKASVEDLKAAHKNEVDKLRSQEAEVTRMQNELRAKEADVGRLEREVTCSKEQLGAQEAKIKQLESDKANIEEKLTSRDATVTKLEAEMTSVQGKLQAREADVSRLETELTSTQAQLSSRTSDVSRLEGEVSALRAEVVLKQSSIHELQLQAEQVQQQMQEAVLAAAENLETMELSGNALQDRIKMLETQYEEVLVKFQSTAESSATERGDLQQQVSSGAAIQQQLQQKIEQLQQQYKKELEEKQQKLSALESSHNSELTSLRRELSLCKSHADEEKCQLESQVEKQATELANTTAALQKATQEVSETQTRLQAVEEKLQQTKTNLEKSEALAAKLEAELHEKENDWSQERQQMIEADCKHQALVLETQSTQKTELERAQINKQEELEKLKREFDMAFAAKEVELKKQLQECRESLLTEHGLEVTQMIEAHLLEKDALKTQLTAAQAEVHRLKSGKSCKEELLLQHSAERIRLSSQCAELQVEIKSLKAQYASALEKCEQQTRECDLISADLKDFKKTCGNLKEALKADKISHMKALEEKYLQYKVKVEEMAQKLSKEFKEKQASLETQLSEKSTLLKNLQSTHEALFEKHQSQEETYTVRVSELLSDVTRLQQEKKEAKRNHKDALAALNESLEKSRSDYRLLENRLQEMTLAREMLKIELSQNKKKHDEIEANLLEKVKCLEESVVQIKKEYQERSGELEMTSGMLDEVRELLRGKEQELSAAHEAHAAKDKSLADEHSEEICTLEDQITHLNKVVDQMKEESELRVKNHEAQMTALREENSKAVAGLQSSFRNEMNKIFEKMKSLPECCKFIKFENDNNASVLECVQALGEDLLNVLAARVELHDRVQSLQEEIRCQQETTDKMLDKEREMKELQLKYDEHVASAKTAVEQMEATVQSKDDEITALKESLTKMELEISECKISYEQQLTHDQNEHKRQVEEQKAEQLLELENLNTLLNAKTMELDNTKSQLENLNTLLSAKTVELDNSKSQLEKLNTLLNAKTVELDNSKSQLEKLVSANSTKIFELEAEVETMKASCSALEEDKRSLERALSESTSNKADLGIKILELEEETKAYKHRLQDKEQAIIKEHEAREAMQKSVDELKEEVAAAQATASEAKAKVEELSLENSTLLALRKQKEKEVSDGGAELVQLQDQLLQLQTKLQRAEATLVDKDKEITSAKEDVMRVERESENSVRSLKEEMAALKLKYKTDKQAYAEKMKSVFKDQIEKLMAEAEKYKSVSDDYTLVLQKYEAAKKKLVTTYAELNEATTAKDDYYQQTMQLKDHINTLRESFLQEKQLRQQAESSVEPLQAELTEAQQSLKAAAVEKRGLLAKLSTADSKLREMDRNWKRESLGGPGCLVASDGGNIRNAVSESTLPTAATAAAARNADSLRKPVTKSASRPVPTTVNSSSTARQSFLNNERPGRSTNHPAAPAKDRPGSSALTASYRKAVGRSSIRASEPRASSSAEEDILDGSDVPLLPDSRLDKSKLNDGLFRKPSIRITATDKLSKLRAPVELRALTCKGDEDEGEEGDEGGEFPPVWEEGEKKLREEKRRKAVEGERKKRLAQRKDGRRMTVDGRILPDDDDDNPSPGSDRALTRSVPRGLGSVFNCEDEDQEFFSNKYLQDMKVGLCVMSNENDTRLSELQRRNSLYPPHMRCSYAAEMQFNPLQDKLDSIQNMHAQKRKKDTGVEELESATERLALESPAFNLRKRKSLSDSLVSADSLEISFGKKVRRLSTSYSRPGPPTPGRKSIGRVDKENRRMSLRSQQGNSPSGRSLSSCPSSSSLPFAPSSRRVSKSPSLSIIQPTPARVIPSKRSSPATKSLGSASGGSTGSPDAGEAAGGRGSRGTPATRRSHLSHTPASIKRLIRGKSPWKKLTDASESFRSPYRW